MSVWCAVILSIILTTGTLCESTDFHRLFAFKMCVMQFFGLNKQFNLDSIQLNWSNHTQTLSDSHIIWSSLDFNLLSFCAYRMRDYCKMCHNNKKKLSEIFIAMANLINLIMCILVQQQQQQRTCNGKQKKKYLYFIPRYKTLNYIIKIHTRSAKFQAKNNNDI